MFDVGIRVTVANQRGVLAKVAAAIAEAGSNIDNVSMDEERSLYTTMHFTLQVANRHAPRQGAARAEAHPGSGAHRPREGLRGRACP